MLDGLTLLTVAKFDALIYCSSCYVIIDMKPSTTLQFLICPLEVAFDRDQNQKCKINFWATCCIGSIKMAIIVLIYRWSLIFLANKKRSFVLDFKRKKIPQDYSFCPLWTTLWDYLYCPLRYYSTVIQNKSLSILLQFYCYIQQYRIKKSTKETKVTASLKVLISQ